jgi:two-component system alkaline phosphatase synthesis response regulator PhoP
MARILIVDDEKDVVDLLTFLLGKDGYEFIAAPDGKVGLERAIKDSPDLIILDIMMPEMDGVQMNSLLLENAATRGIPVIVLTAKGRMREAFEKAPNVHAYMEKPFDGQELRQHVANALKLKKDNPAS